VPLTTAIAEPETESPEEADDLLPAVNSPEVVERLVNENIRLAHFFASKRSFASGMNADDALSLAMQGLLRAAQLFDESRGKFGTYAAWHIKSRLGRDPLRKKSIKAGYYVSQVSLDDPIGFDGTTYADFIADEREQGALENLLGSDSALKVREWVAKLPEKQRYIITHRFGLDGGAPQTLEEISRVFNVTRERVRQIEEATLKKLAFSAKAAQRIEEHPDQPVVVVPPARTPSLRRSSVKNAEPTGKTSDSKNTRVLTTEQASEQAKRKEALRAYRKQHYLKNKAAISARCKASYKKKREETLRRVKKWQSENIVHVRKHVHVRKQRKKRYIAQQAEAVSYHMLYYYANHEELLVRQATARKKHRTKIRAYAKNKVIQLTDCYVREQLSKYSSKSCWEWTPEEVAAKRQAMLALRARRLTDAQVREVIARARKGERPAHIAKDYACHPSTIHNICTGRTRN